MFLYNLHVAWDNHALPKKFIGKSRILNYKKYNAILLSEKMARKQKEFN